MPALVSSCTNVSLITKIMLTSTEVGRSEKTLHLRNSYRIFCALIFKRYNIHMCFSFSNELTPLSQIWRFPVTVFYTFNFSRSCTSIWMLNFRHLERELPLDSRSYQWKSDLTFPCSNLSNNKENILLLTLQTNWGTQKDVYEKHKIWSTTGSN